MCGRFTHMYLWKQLHRLYALSRIPIAEPDAALFAASYNVAPTQMVPIVRVDDAGVGYLSALKWGLVPFWAADLMIGNGMINAKSEEVADKPAYREAFKARRCLIPASGFYEWQTVPGEKTKQPWYFTVKDEPVFSIAGLWERNTKATGEPVETFTLMTGEPNDLVAPIHNRMPCIVRSKHYGLWLDVTKKTAAEIAPALSAYPAESMTAWKVSPQVGSTRNNEASLVERAA